MAILRGGLWPHLRHAGSPSGAPALGGGGRIYRANRNQTRSTSAEQYSFRSNSPPACVRSLLSRPSGKEASRHSSSRDSTYQSRSPATHTAAAPSPQISFRQALPACLVQLRCCPRDVPAEFDEFPQVTTALGRLLERRADKRIITLTGANYCLTNHSCASRAISAGTVCAPSNSRYDTS